MLGLLGLLPKLKCCWLKGRLDGPGWRQKNVLGLDIVEAYFGWGGDVLKAPTGGKDNRFGVLLIRLKGVQVGHTLNAILEERSLI
jgi:hypothetical protein